MRIRFRMAAEHFNFLQPGGFHIVKNSILPVIVA
jgi:hypothetical protein